MPSRATWFLADWRRRIARRWYTADKALFAAVILPGLVLAGLGLGVQWHFARQDERREAARETERRELDCLARNVYYESRGEPLAGMYAVAEVTMNRTASRLYPGTVCEVVRQKNWDPIRGRFVGAFSWTEFRTMPEPTGAAWAQAREVAEAVYYRRVPAKFPGVMHFHATYVSPEWAKEKKVVARIGQHVFYR